MHVNIHIKALPDSIQKVAILGSKFPISTVSPTIQRKINGKSNKRYLKVEKEEKGEAMIFIFK